MVWDYSDPLMTFNNPAFTMAGGAPAVGAWNYASTAMTYGNPAYNYAGGGPPSSLLVWNVYAEPQEDPNTSWASIFPSVRTGPILGHTVYRAIFAAPQVVEAPQSWVRPAALPLIGAVRRAIIGRGQDDPSQIGSQVFHPPIQRPYGIVNEIVTAFPQVDLTIQGWVVNPNPLGGPTVTPIQGAPQSVDLTIQGWIHGTSQALQGRVPPTVLIQQADPTQIQSAIFKPLIAPPIIPGPVSPFIGTLPQFEDRPSRWELKPLVGHAVKSLPWVSGGPQLIDLSPQGWVKGTAPGAHGRVPPLVQGVPPQRDFTVAAQVFRPLARIAYGPIRLTVAGPQSVDLTIQGWIQEPLSAHGSVPAFTRGVPPDQDLSIQGQIYPTAPGLQGTTPGYIQVPPQAYDFTLQAWIIPDDAEPPSAFTYAYTVITITALAQLPFKTAQSVFIEDSACLIETAYVSLAGTLFVPASVQYRIDDVTSGENIVPWTSVTPSTGNQIFVTAQQNAMISNSLPWEAHQFLVQIVDGTGNEYNAKQIFYIKRVPGYPNWTDSECGGNC